MNTLAIALRNALLILSCAGFLAACGGGSEDGLAAHQAHQVAPAQKTTGLAPTAASYQNVTQELYLAYFGRPADPVGLANVEATLLAAGAPTDAAGLAAAYSTNAAVKTLVDSFATSKEAQTLYNGTSTITFVSDVYQYLFGRAPAVAGLTYWSTAISSGSLNQAAAALAIMGGAASNNTTQGQSDAQTVTNRLSFATNFTIALSAQHLATAYSGSNAAALLRVYVAGITANTSASTITTDVLSCIQQLSGGSAATNLPVLNSVAWSGTQFVAVGLGGVVETSPDGITWTNRGSAFAAPLSAADLRSVIWQNNRFLAVGVNGGGVICTSGAACPTIVAARLDSVLSSPDGITWTSAVSNASLAAIPQNSELNSIAWNGTQYVAVGDQINGTGSVIGDFGHVLFSTDGENWSATTQYVGLSNAVGVLPALAGVAWSESQFVAVGNGIFPSANGSVWNVNSVTGNYTGIASSGSLFVVTGLSGALFSSPDGLNWTQHSITTDDLYGITWSGTQFVAVGAGVILTSPDGTNWATHDAGTASHLYGVTWSGTQFVAVGEGAIVTSKDGATWTPQVLH
ncbi:MAG: DUF4214 domain-containing protein [Burkholderiaceae bacterium]|nr:DUF4214 domain-containing protein [Burkholderiaceae bacterium]